MVAEEDYKRPSSKAHQPKRLVEFLRQSPLLGMEIRVDRKCDCKRDFELQKNLSAPPTRAVRRVRGSRRGDRA